MGLGLIALTTRTIAWVSPLTPRANEHAEPPVVEVVVEE